MTAGGILCIFAHPDDETFGVGGIVAMYADRGVPVTMVCATRGEAGEISPSSGATPETLPAFRDRELRDAMRILGVTDVRFLDFRDSGMEGTPENDDPRSLHQANPEDVVRPLVAVIRERRPQALVTWDPSGGYGHPDHVAVHRHATAAYHAAAESDRFPDLGEPWRTPALFYNVIPADDFDRMRERLQERGIDFGEIPGGQENFERLERLRPNTVIDVRAQVSRKRQALLAHRTQIDETGPFAKMPDDIATDFFGHEHFYRVEPPVPEGIVLHDLLEELT